MLYKIKRCNGYWTVQTLSGLIQFKHSSRQSCIEWKAENELQIPVDSKDLV